MILWTIQDYAAYQKLTETGILLADEEYVFEKDYFEPVYRWLYEQMIKRIGYPLAGVKYPVWAWYQWDGKRKKPDMRKSAYAERGKKVVRLTVKVEDKDVLLSDFDLYHSPLNYGYLSLTEEEDNYFDAEYKLLGFEYHDLQDCSIRTPEMLKLREKMKRSWERIFDINLEPNDWIVESMDKKSIQATMWCIRKDQIIKAEEFIAR